MIPSRRAGVTQRCPSFPRPGCLAAHDAGDGTPRTFTPPLSAAVAGHSSAVPTASPGGPPARCALLRSRPLLRPCGLNHGSGLVPIASDTEQSHTGPCGW